GERNRLNLALTLKQGGNLLLLDEPTNDLDVETLSSLENALLEFPGCAVVVSHDRWFLDRVATHILAYEGDDENPSKWYWFEGNFESYEEMAAEADRTRKLDFEEIQIPPGPRLGGLVLEAKNLQKGFEDRVLIDGLSFTLPRNGIVGVIGPNGVGKTTLFKTIVGLEPLDGGDLKIGDSVKISYADQSRGGIDPNKTLWEVVSDGLDFIQVGNVEMPSRAYVAAFGFKGPDQQKKAGVLSGGERNRLNLALTLKQGGNLLLLDEPTNDLDVETLSSLENALLEFPGCAVVVSHDRWFLDRVATHILAYEGDDDNPSKWYWFEGNFESYEENKIQRLGPDAAKPHRVTHRRLTRD
ncbi:MAG TPA: ATP-binding cassette domain-containing protein, partial [Arthrobacter sp.]